MSTGNSESTPQFEFAPPPQSGENLPEQNEQQTASQETQTQAPQAQPTGAAFQLPETPVDTANQAAPVPVNDNAQPVSSATAHLHADDSDLIEKEWVERAKHIVATTQDDPFKQKNEISKAKADYIKKRFNKTVKVDDAAGA